MMKTIDSGNLTSLRIARCIPECLKVNWLSAGIARSIGWVNCRSVDSFVFVATTGRSGTASLSPILRSIPGCCSVHEPHPIMNAAVLRASQDGDYSLVRHSFYRRKLPTILWTAAGCRWYVETNHQFIKSFAKEAIDAFGGRLKVIHLVRDRIATAASFLHRRSIPGSNCYLPDYRNINCRVAMKEVLERDDILGHDFFKCLWYWHETEALVNEFLSNNPTVPVIHITTSDLNDVTALVKLLTFLGMPVDHQLIQELCGLRANSSEIVPRVPEQITSVDIARFDSLLKELTTKPES